MKVDIICYANATFLAKEEFLNCVLFSNARSIALGPNRTTQHPAITLNIESFFIKTVGEGTVNLTPLEEEYCYKSPFPQGISADDVSELDPFEDDEPSTNSKDDHPIPEHVFQFVAKKIAAGEFDQKSQKTPPSPKN